MYNTILVTFVIFTVLQARRGRQEEETNTSQRSAPVTIKPSLPAGTSILQVEGSPIRDQVCVCVCVLWVYGLPWFHVFLQSPLPDTESSTSSYIISSGTHSDTVRLCMCMCVRVCGCVNYFDFKYPFRGLSLTRSRLIMLQNLPIVFFLQSHRYCLLML